MSVAAVDKVRSQTRQVPRGKLFSPGKVVDNRFTVKAMVGSGGMGTVMRVWDRWSNSMQAIKFSLDNSAALIAEGDTLEKLHRGNLNPHIVGYSGRGEYKTIPYLVLEYIEGTTLDNAPSLDLPRALEIAASICYGLRPAVQQGITHNDLKPSNIMLRKRDGAPVIIDFGLSTYRAAKGLMAGTLGYASPEQLRGEDLDHRTDIYSLGVIFFEMVARRRGFPDTGAEGISEMLAKRVYFGLPDVKFGSHPIEQTTGPSVQQLIKQMTALDKNDRPATYDSILAEIERIKDEIKRVSGSISAFADQIPPFDPLGTENLSSEMPTISD